MVSSGYIGIVAIMNLQWLQLLAQNLNKTKLVKCLA